MCISLLDVMPNVMGAGSDAGEGVKYSLSFVMRKAWEQPIMKELASIVKSRTSFFMWNP
jgi:hypothetical protein